MSTGTKVGKHFSSFGVSLSLAAALVGVLAATAAPVTARQRRSRVRVARGEWPMYGHDLHHTWMNRRERRIRRSTAPRIIERWRFPTEGSVTAPPSVVGAHVYVGDWAGVVYKLRAWTGELVWEFVTDFDPAVDMTFNSSGGHITTGVTVAEVRVPGKRRRERWLYVGSGKTVYCLRDMGAKAELVWKRVLPGNPEAPDAENDLADPNLIESSPVLFEGHLYLGTTVDGAQGYRGGFVKLDALTGALEARFEIDQGAGGVLVNRGCGSMWTTPAVDEKLHLLYFGTADCVRSEQNPALPGGVAPQPPWHECLLALSTEDLSVRWSFCPHQFMGDPCDSEFGSSPVLFRAGRRHLVAQGSKNGTFYAFDAETGEWVWEHRVVAGGTAGGFIAPAATDGRRIYAATGIGDLSSRCPIPGSFDDWKIQTPQIHVFDARTGRVIWQATRSPAFAPASLVRGLLIQPSTLGSGLDIFDAAKGGDPIFHARLASFGSSGAAIARGMIFLGSGQGFGAGDAVYGFGLP